MSGLVFIVSAPSGSGKSTLTNELLRSVPGLQFSISYTTRLPRGSEQNGREYFFVSRENFEHMIEADEFLEHACVFGDYYGTSARFLREAHEQGKDLVMDIDVQGAAQVKKKIPQAISVFILPPSRQELEKRLNRRSESEKQFEGPERRRSDEQLRNVIRLRLETAAREIENFSNYDYILVNDQLEQSIDRLKAIVVAERLKRSGVVPSAEDQRTLQTAEHCLLPNVRGQVQQILDSFTASSPR